MALVPRATVLSPKTRLSKYETALEGAYKQTTLYTASVDDTSTLTYVPDFVVVPDQDNSATAIVLPTGADDEGKICTVINNDADEGVTVGGATCPLGEKTVIRFDGSSWVVLYSAALA